MNQRELTKHTRDLIGLCWWLHPHTRTHGRNLGIYQEPRGNLSICAYTELSLFLLTMCPEQGDVRTEQKSYILHTILMAAALAKKSPQTQRSIYDHHWCQVNSRENSSSAGFLNKQTNKQPPTCPANSQYEKSAKPKVSLVKYYPSYYTVPFPFHKEYCLLSQKDFWPQSTNVITKLSNTSFLKNINDRCKGKIQTMKRIIRTLSCELWEKRCT